MKHNIYDFLNTHSLSVCFNPPSFYKSSPLWTCPSGPMNTCYPPIPLLESMGMLLTYKQVPLGVEISLICQAALHDIEAVVVAWSHSGESSTISAV